MENQAVKATISDMEKGVKLIYVGVPIENEELLTLEVAAENNGYVIDDLFDAEGNRQALKFEKVD